MNYLCFLFTIISIAFAAIDQLLFYAFIPGIIGLICGLIAKRRRHKNTTLPIIASSLMTLISFAFNILYLCFHYFAN